ncbi:EamA family transporter RarD [Algicola sagamiensis]|uniref:EamA family transporter RarD n=1 Tax=Algicola sagamiensis TaxID=163869 RepID=UPI00036981AE|nr:EamA family transporter RarD [Algicola sagamiensis]
MEQETRKGVYLALFAFVFWGVAPVYFKLLDAVPATEILLHRIIWSFVLLFLLLIFTKQLYKAKAIFKNPKQMLYLGSTAMIIGGNWWLFIWAVNQGHILEASLGYYINPLLNVLLGTLFLNERLRKGQMFAVGLAMCGVLVQLVALGSLPIISLVLASSFAVYGLLRKQLAVDSIVGLWFESMLLLPIALGAWYFGDWSHYSDWTQAPNLYIFGLIMAGAITTIPLVSYTAAAKRLTYTTIGFLQYIGPSLMFLLGVFAYGETISMEKLTSFIFIWTALFVFTLDSIRTPRITPKTT